MSRCLLFGGEAQVAKYDAIALDGTLQDSRPFKLKVSVESGEGRENLVSLVVDGQKVNLPKESYASLRNLQTRQSYLLTENASLFLVLQGGDGGEAYSCVLVVQEGKLIRREMYKPPFQYYGGRPPTSQDVY